MAPCHAAAEELALAALDVDQDRGDVALAVCWRLVGCAQAKLLEHNVRFGDPECQTLMARFDGDLTDTLLKVRRRGEGVACTRWPPLLLTTRCKKVTWPLLGLSALLILACPSRPLAGGDRARQGHPAELAQRRGRDGGGGRPGLPRRLPQGLAHQGPGPHHHSKGAPLPPCAPVIPRSGPGVGSATNRRVRRGQVVTTRCAACLPRRCSTPARRSTPAGSW